MVASVAAFAAEPRPGWRSACRRRKRRNCPQEAEEEQRHPHKPLWVRFQAAMEEHGGAQQYLLQKYPDEESQKRFAEALLEEFPRREEVDYYLFKCCPRHDLPVAVHICDWGFGESATTKPPP